MGIFSTHSNSLKKGNGIGNMPTLTKKEKKNGHLFIILYRRTHTYIQPSFSTGSINQIAQDSSRILLDAEDWDNIIERNKNNPEAQAYIRKADKCLNHR